MNNLGLILYYFLSIAIVLIGMLFLSASLKGAMIVTCIFSFMAANTIQEYGNPPITPVITTYGLLILCFFV